MKAKEAKIANYSELKYDPLGKCHGCIHLYNIYGGYRCHLKRCDKTTLINDLI